MKTGLGIEKVVSELEDVLGIPLTAFVAGAKDRRAISQWEKGKQPSGDEQYRLRLASRAVQILQKSEAPETIRSWFVGTFLGGRSPAMVISEASKGDYELKARVIRAAEEFLKE